MDQKKLKLMIMPLLLVAGLTFFAPQKPAEAFTNQVIQQGSVGEDVTITSKTSVYWFLQW